MYLSYTYPTTAYKWRAEIRKPPSPGQQSDEYLDFEKGDWKDRVIRFGPNRWIMDGRQDQGRASVGNGDLSLVLRTYLQVVHRYIHTSIQGTCNGACEAPVYNVNLKRNRTDMDVETWNGAERNATMPTLSVLYRRL